MPSGSTRVTVTFLYSFPLSSLKSSATATVVKHRIRKGTTFILKLGARFEGSRFGTEESCGCNSNDKWELIKHRLWQEYDDCCHCCHAPVTRKSGYECTYDQ